MALIMACLAKIFFYEEKLQGNAATFTLLL